MPSFIYIIGGLTMTNDIFIKLSLEYNLFFLRIMMEHAYFIHTALPSKNIKERNEAKQFHTNYSNHLNKAIESSYEIVEMNDAYVTKYTLAAEQQTSFLTGEEIDFRNTKNELNWKKHTRTASINNFLSTINELNETSILLTKGFVRFKTRLMENLSLCKLFMNMYDTMLEHLRHEAVIFIDILMKLQNKDNPIDSIQNVFDQEKFWNHIMEEHAEFTDGLLDPKEKELKETSRKFAMKYDKQNHSINTASTLPRFTLENTSLTAEFQKFKTAGIEGILDCKIKSLILPLLGDHILREANFYLQLLAKIKKL